MKRISEMGLDRTAAERFVETHVCRCGGLLTVAFGGAFNVNELVVRCSRAIEHSDFEKPYRIPLAASGLPYIKPSKKEVERMSEQVGTEAMTKLIPYQNKGILSQTEAELVVRTIWPEAPDADRTRAAMVCAQYGLNPLMRHVFLIPFKEKESGIVNWSMVMGIQATRLIAARGMAYSYVDDTPRVMTDAEQTRRFGKIDSAKIWAITKIRRRDGMEFAGYGGWPKNQAPKGVEKGNTQENMAFIRSERNALDRGAPGALPKDVDVVDEAYAEPMTVVEATGEVLEPSYAEPRQRFFDYKYGDVLRTCPEHGVDWYIDNYGHLAHDQEVDGKPKRYGCQLRDWLKPVQAEILEQVEMTDQQLNAMTKARFGDTHSRIAEADLVTILDELWHKQIIWGPPGTVQDNEQSEAVEPEVAEAEARLSDDEYFKGQVEGFTNQLGWKGDKNLSALLKSYFSVSALPDLPLERRDALLHKLADLVAVK